MKRRWVSLVPRKFDKVVLQLAFQHANLLILEDQKTLVRFDLVLKLLHPDLAVGNVLKNLCVRSCERAPLETAPERECPGVLLDVVLLCRVVYFFATTRTKDALILSCFAKRK